MLEAAPCFLERRVCKPAWTPSGVERAVARSAVWAHEGYGAGRGAAWRARARCQCVGETTGAIWEPMVQVRERRICARKRRGWRATGSWTGASNSALSSMTNTFLAHVMKAVGGPHRAERIAHPAVLATQCPACATAFRRRSIPVAHFCAERRKRAGAQQTEAHMTSQRNLQHPSAASAMRASVARKRSRVSQNTKGTSCSMVCRWGRFVSAGACLSLKPTAAERLQVQGSPRRKGVRRRVGRLGSIEERWSKAEGGGRERAREVAVRSRGANEVRSSTEQ